MIERKTETSYQIPLAFNKVPKLLKAKKALSVAYTARKYDAQTGLRPQRILAGRSVLFPCLDLNRFRCNAIIDWIEILLVTEGRHQATNIQRWLGEKIAAVSFLSTAYVSGPNREHRFIGSEFRIRLQQPRPRHLTEILTSLCDKYAPNTLAPDLMPITGIEISVDFHIDKRFHGDAETASILRWQVVDTLRRHLRPAPALTEANQCKPRSFGEKHGGNGATFFVESNSLGLSPELKRAALKYGLEPGVLVPLNLRSHNSPMVDLTSYIGARDHPVMLRIMDKVTDQRNPEIGKVMDLPAEARRGRLEVTLQGKIDQIGGHGALGLSTVGDIRGYDFKIIRPLVFEFFLPTFRSINDISYLGTRISATEETVFSRSGVYGLDRFHRAEETLLMARYKRKEISGRPVPLGKKGRLMSWVQMNQKIDRSLAKLSKDWTVL